MTTFWFPPHYSELPRSTTAVISRARLNKSSDPVFGRWLPAHGTPAHRAERLHSSLWQFAGVGHPPTHTRPILSRSAQRTAVFP